MNTLSVRALVSCAPEPLSCRFAPAPQDDFARACVSEQVILGLGALTITLLDAKCATGIVLKSQSGSYTGVVLAKL